MKSIRCKFLYCLGLPSARPARIVHHLHELRECYVLDVVLSELGYDLLEVFLGVAPVCQGLLQVMPGDLPLAVSVIVLESQKKDFLVGYKFLVARGNHEFLKLNLPVLVVVYVSEECKNMQFGQPRLD